MANPNDIPVLCIGGALVDRTYRLKAPAVGGSSNPAALATSFGGVARNVADSLARLGVRVALATTVGDDAAGAALVADVAARGVDVSRIRRIPGAATAEYAAVLDEAGGLVLGIAAMDAAEQATEAAIAAMLGSAPEEALIFADANLTAPALRSVLDHARQTGAFLALDAVSVAKAARLPRDLGGVGLLVMNRDEAAAVLGEIGPLAAQATHLTGRGAATAVVTAGAEGACLADAAGVLHAPSLPARTVNVTGAGDALVAAMLWRIAQGESPRQALPWGIAAAGLTTESAAATHTDLSPAFLAAALSRMPTA